MIRQALVEYIVNALWQIPLLAAGAWLFLQAVRPGVKMQHGVWLTTFVLAVLLPLHGSAPQAGSAAAQHEAESPLVRVPETLYEPPAENGWQPVAREWMANSPRMRHIRLTAKAMDWVIGVYAASVMFGVFRIAGAWRVARHLVETSWETILSCPGNAVFLTDYARRFGVRLPRLRESCEVSSPMIVGMVQPVLLLPEGFGLHTEAEVKAALCHELAHVRRRDYLVNFACQVMALPVVWHPVTHGIQRRIRKTREMVCDAMAAEEMQSETTYARYLLAIARDMNGGDNLAEPMGLGLFSNNALEERIMQLMGTKTAMSMRAKAARVASGVSAMTIATAMTVMFHVAPTMAASTSTADRSGTVQIAQTVQSPQPVASGISNPDAADLQEDKTSKVKKTDGRHDKDANRRSYAVIDGERQEPEHRELTPEERARIDKEIADAQKQMHEAMEKVNGPEFRARLQEQMKDVQRQMERSQQQIAESNAWINSPEFKRQIEDAQKKATEMHAWMNSPEFKEQMEDRKKVFADMHELQQIRTDAMKGLMEKLNSPEYKRQMEEMQQKIAEATAKLNDPALQQRMEELNRRIQERQTRRMEEMMQRFNQPKDQHPTPQPAPDKPAPENSERFLM